MRKRIVLLLVLFAVFMLNIQASAVTDITDMTLYFGETVKWYDYQTDQAMLVGDDDGLAFDLGAISAFEAGGEDYLIISGMVEMTASDLVDDLTVANGGFAMGEFGSSAVLTVTGQVFNVDQGTFGNPGLLFTARIVENWLIEEDPDAPGTIANGKAEFAVDSGPLMTGANPHGLVLQDFFINFDFTDIAPNPLDDFENSPQNYAGNGELQFIIPEPMTLVLLGFGGVALLRRK